MDPNTQNVTLTMTVLEANTVLRALGRLPYEEVVTVVQKVKEQGESQIAELTKTTQTDSV